MRVWSVRVGVSVSGKEAYHHERRLLGRTRFQVRRGISERFQGPLPEGESQKLASTGLSAPCSLDRGWRGERCGSSGAAGNLPERAPCVFSRAQKLSCISDLALS